MPKRNGSPMASEESKKIDDKKSPISKGSMPPVNEESKLEISTISPTEVDLMEDLTKLKSQVNKLQTELRDGLLMVSKKLGEFAVTQSASIRAANFQSDLLEEVNDRCVDSNMKATITEKRVDSLEQQARESSTRMDYIHQEVRQIPRKLNAEILC